MSLKYNVQPMKIGFGKDKEDAFVARAQLGETVETEQLVEQVALRTQQQKAAVRIVLDNLVESIYHFCEVGNGVRVGELGIIKPALETRSAAEAKDVEIVKPKYNFLPSSKMKQVLVNLSIRKVGDAAPDAGSSSDKPGTGGGDGGGDDILT